MEKREGKKNAVVRLRESDPFVEVGSSTITVLLRDRLLTWVVKELCVKAPSLNTIFLALWALREAEHNNPSALRICEARGIRLLGRSIRSRKNPWKTRRLVPPPTFQRYRSFLLSLSGEHKERFQELLLLGWPEAHATSRYYCLQGEQYVSLREIAEKHDWSSANVAQRKIRAVLLYLDPNSVEGYTKEAKRRVKVIERGVTRLREEGIALKEIIGSPLVTTPAGMPLTPAYVQEFKLILAKSLNGEFEQLRQEHPRDSDVLTLRFGLEDGRFRTLEEVGEELKGITRERVRQLEQRALDYLGISVLSKR